jgi:uncharacterized membrane protein YoaK (UPF0700 family)
MFVAQAHSFVSQARLAITLAWVAGYTNIVALLSCGHVTSHVSGTTSDLGRGVAEGRWPMVGFYLFLMVMFFVGAVISGATTELGRRRGWESIYVLPMAIEALLLGVFAAGVQLHDAGGVGGAAGIESGWMLYLMTGSSSAAMGLQNATITRISSGVVRTTHVTGVLTDLGLETVGMAQRWIGVHRQPAGKAHGAAGRDRQLHAEGRTPGAGSNPRRWLLLMSIVGSFALGAGLGTLAFDHFPAWSMFPPVLFLIWIVVQDIKRPIAEIEPSDLVGISGLHLPPGIAVYRLRKDQRGRDRPGVIHRMPDLSGWIERLPDEVTVAILDLTEVRQLSDNAGDELALGFRRLAEQGRRLLLAGITREHYEQLARSVHGAGHAGGAGAGGLLPIDDVSPDVELAIARGMNVLEDEQAAANRAGGK